MKVAIITDSHYGAKKGSKYLHDYFELFYKNVFFPALEEHGVEAVIHMGDAFDSRKSIDYQSLEWSKRVVFVSKSWFCPGSTQKIRNKL